MDRRHCLRAGLSLVCCSALVGCLDEVDAAVGSDDGADIEVEDRTGDRALARAVGRLNDAALELDVDAAESEGSAFDPDPARNRLADARGHLETAATELEADRQSDVDELRAYADVLEALVDVTTVVTDDSHEDAVDDVSVAIEERHLEDASATSEELSETFARADDRFETAESDFAALDGETLAGLSVVDLAEIESGMATLEGALGAVVALVTALESTVAGYECLERGEDHADDEEHERAKSSFLDAEVAFAASTATLEDGRGDAPADLESRFEVGLCQNAHLETAAGHFVAATEATMDREPRTARNRRAAGEEAIEATENC